MNKSEWVVDRLYNELRYMSDRGSRQVNTDLLLGYIDLLKEQAVFLEEKLHQESVDRVIATVESEGKEVLQGQEAITYLREAIKIAKEIDIYAKTD